MLVSVNDNYSVPLITKSTNLQDWKFFSKWVIVNEAPTIDESDNCSHGELYVSNKDED